MPERRVFCGDLTTSRRRSDDLHIDLNATAGLPTRVNLEIGDLSKPLADPIPEELIDLLEIATYVFCADQFTKRGSSQMKHMGAEWRRQFRFRIPVRRTDVWTDPEIAEALKETLGFLSEDEYEFSFERASHLRPLQIYLPLNDPAAQKIMPEEVVLFSGGLDSLTGAVEAMVGDKKRVALVSHRSSNMIASKQTGLSAELRERTPPKTFFYVPVSINKGHEEATEFTQRTRSFMFATLGFVVARMFGRHDLSFYENGVVSINLPISEHVLGARASRTTHPRFIVDCSRLFSLLLSNEFKINNPYLWKTKTDVVRTLADRGCPDLIARSFSCTRVREATRENRHCGVCSQCIDRRFAILAAGLSAYDPPENYAVDLFTGAQKAGADLTMVESYVLRAQKLASMSQEAFAANYGQIFRAIPYLSGSAEENVIKLWDLHRRHAHDVTSVIDGELKAKASIEAVLSLPPTSLLSMVLSPIAAQPAYSDPIEAEPAAPQQAVADTHDYSWRRIRFALDSASHEVIFEGGLIFAGVMFHLIAALAEDFASDLATGRGPREYRYLKAAKLAERLRIDLPSLRRRVSRARRKLEAGFLNRFDQQLDSEDIIQSKEWNGYRLNPYLQLLNPAQLRDPK